MREPLVSIACLTYNQEKFIRDALDGFLMQKTSFPFEIVIHDDASTDSTPEIIREYVDKHAGVIVPIFQQENQYSKGINIEFEFVFPKCRGKYVGLCEGDDFWTDPNKLQKQVDFLERSSEYGLCYTKVRVLDQRTNAQRVWGRSIASFEDQLLSGGVPTLTPLFRRGLLDGYSSEVLPYSTDWKVGDYPLWLYLSTKTKFKLLDGIAGTYRVHGEGVYQGGSSDKQLDFIRSSYEIKKFFADKFHVSETIKKQCLVRYYCDSLHLAFLADRTELIGEAKVFFEANHFRVLRGFVALFALFKNNRFALSLVNHSLQRYRRYRFRLK